MPPGTRRFTCGYTSAASVRAEGLEPSRSFEHRHLKPARMPFRHARGAGSYRLDHPPTCRLLLPSLTVRGRLGFAERAISARSSGRSAARYRHYVSTTRRRRPALIALVHRRRPGLSRAGLVAVAAVRVRVGHRPEPRLRAAVAALRGVRRLRLSQVRPLRGRAAAAAQARHRHRNPRRAAARTPQAGTAEDPDDPALTEYNAYLAELAKPTTNTTGPPHDIRQPQRTQAKSAPR